VFIALVIDIISRREELVFRMIIQPSATHVTRRHSMFIAIAMESYTSETKQNDYKVWYLDVNDANRVTAIGVKTREEILENILSNLQQYKESCWRVFAKETSRSVPIELYDFISQNIHENTHFGNLPTLREFQGTLDQLQMNMELKSIA
jgi:hypothetical protein